MQNWIVSQTPLTLTVLATFFTWGMTALGASLVFFFKEAKQELMDAMLGFAAGIMVAAAFFSLLLPAIEYSESAGIPVFIPTVTGFLAGCAFLFLADQFIPHLHEGSETPQGVSNHLNKSALLILAIVLHNIPEGLAVGVAIGALSQTGDPIAIMSAIPLALGIGIQNFPEGAAVSLPAKRDGLTTIRAFMYGQFSGMVEPLAGIIGVIAVSSIKPALPYAMSFAAGAMIYVVFDEIIPTAHENGKSRLTTVMAIIGFALMMLLDLSLG